MRSIRPPGRPSTAAPSNDPSAMRVPARPPAAPVLPRWRYGIVCLMLLGVCCGRVPLLGRLVDGDTLPERTSRAEIIIVGKLLSVNERAIVDEDLRRDGPQYYTHYTYYDIGKIAVLEILKGMCEGNTILVKFLSFDQTQPNQLEIDCRHFSYHDIWKPGIWLIDIDTAREPSLLVRRGNYLPSGRRGAVMDLLEEE